MSRLKALVSKRRKIFKLDRGKFLERALSDFAIFGEVWIGDFPPNPARVMDYQEVQAITREAQLKACGLPPSMWRISAEELEELRIARKELQP